MQIKRALCLFEQSGTFKREFIKLGIPAEDYDILNEFGETDHVCDLFEQIGAAYDGKPSLFDHIGPEDIVLAFFPCTRFEAQVQMWFAGTHYTAQKMSDLQKLEYVLKLHEELHFLYSMLCKLFIISNRGVEACGGKPGNASALSDHLFPDPARHHRPGQNRARGLLQKAHTILVCKLQAGAKHVL